MYKYVCFHSILYEFPQNPYLNLITIYWHQKKKEKKKKEFEIQ